VTHVPDQHPRTRAADLRVVVLLLALTLTACTIGETTVTARTWDLSETRHIDAIGWPDDVDGTGWSVPDGTVGEIVLADGSTLDVTGTRVVAGRDGDDLEEVVLRFPDQTVAEALARARGLAEEVGADPAPLLRWAGRNATSVDLSAAGNDAFTDAEVGDLVVTVVVRSPEDGRGTVSVELFWPH
jgi:hypothetical protein